MIILDTDVLSDLEWAASSKAQQLLRRLRLSEDEIAVTIISFEEQMRGWMSSIANKKTVVEQIDVYRRLKRQLGYYCKIPILEFTETAAVRFQALRKAKVRIDTMDLKIACIVLDMEATFLTHNGRDFVKVPNLKLEIVK